MKRILLSALLATTCFSANAAVVVIGNPMGIDNISINDVKNLYLGKTKKVAGTPVQLVELVEGMPERTEFHEKTTGRSDAQLQSNWSRLVFTGKAEAPELADDSVAMLQTIQTNKNAIGYIDESQVTPDVKVLLKL